MIKLHTRLTTAITHAVIHTDGAEIHVEEEEIKIFLKWKVKAGEPIEIEFELLDQIRKVAEAITLT